jgi:hypothetical protein
MDQTNRFQIDCNPSTRPHLLSSPHIRNPQQLQTPLLRPCTIQPSHPTQKLKKPTCGRYPIRAPLFRVTTPPLWLDWPAMIFKSVDLPAPLGPTMASLSPALRGRWVARGFGLDGAGEGVLR